MKKLFFISSLVFFISFLASCSKDEGFKFDTNKKLALNAKNQALKHTVPHLSASEVVKQTTIVGWENKGYASYRLERGFADETQRDYVNNRLLMHATDVIGQYGELITSFIEGSNFILEAWTNEGTPRLHKDTIAYIPNSVIRDAELAIKKAYAEKNYSECYRLMDVAFVFIPITGEEYRVLQTQNKN